MPNVVCKCGNILRYGNIPSQIEYKFISDVKYDQFQGQVDSEQLYLQMESFLKCSDCERLWVFWNGFNSKPSVYLLSEN